jgi:hypothetical protein
MNRTSTLTRLRRSVQSIAPVVAPIPPAPSSHSEPAELGKELARGFAEEMARYRRSLESRWPLPNPNDPIAIDDLLAKSPEDTTFFDLERLFNHDSALGPKRWREIRRAARDSLESGWRAGRALEYMGGSAWSRASFLAIRERLREAWPPRHVGDALLIDEMAQYEFLRMQWVAVLALNSREPVLPQRTNVPEGEPRRLSAVESTAEAVRMVERFQKLFQNTLRMLLKARGEKLTTPRTDWYNSMLAARTPPG